MAGINHIDESEYFPSLKFRNNMENKEQAANKWFEDNGWNIYNHYDTRPAFKAGASWQSSQPINSELTQLKAENERLKEQIELQKVNYINLSNQLHKITNP